jgi:hypothetical protein
MGLNNEAQASHLRLHFCDSAVELATGRDACWNATGTIAVRNIPRKTPLATGSALLETHGLLIQFRMQVKALEVWSVAEKKMRWSDRLPLLLFFIQETQVRQRLADLNFFEENQSPLRDSEHHLLHF